MQKKKTYIETWPLRLVIFLVPFQISEIGCFMKHIEEVVY